MPRVLWVADKLGYGDRLHGLGAYFKQVVPAFSTDELTPLVLRSTDGLAAQFSAAGVRLERVQHGRLDPRTLLTLIRRIRAEKIEVLHLHGFGASTFGRIAAWWTGCRAIIHQHDNIMHAPWYGKVCDRLLKPWTYRALAVSDTVAEYCTTHRYIEPERVEVIINAVAAPEPMTPQARAAWRQEQQIAEDAYVIGSLTRLREEKGMRYLVQAMPAVRDAIPNAVLLVFGDGDEREELEQLATELGVAAQIRFLGFQPNAAQFVSLFDCFVLPSLSEGLPFALMEAMACGRPCVVSAVGGMAELLTDERDALLVPAGAPEPLAAALIRMAQDTKLREACAKRSLELSQTFSLERHVDQLRTLYAHAAADAAASLGAAFPVDDA